MLGWSCHLNGIIRNNYHCFEFSFLLKPIAVLSCNFKFIKSRFVFCEIQFVRFIVVSCEWRISSIFSNLRRTLACYSIKIGPTTNSRQIWNVIGISIVIMIIWCEIKPIFILKCQLFVDFVVLTICLWWFCNFFVLFCCSFFFWNDFNNSLRLLSNTLTIADRFCRLFWLYVRLVGLCF